MKYIKYWNYFTDNLHDGFLVKEDERYLYLCYPLVYEWIEKMGDFSLLEQVQLISVLKKDFHYVEETYVSKYEEWIFHFPLEEREMNHFQDVTKFFDYFFHHSRATLTKRLERTIGDSPKSLDKKTIKKCIEFILNHFKDDPERLRVTFSSVIQKHLYPKETYIHQYIHYYDTYAGERFEAYLLKEDDDSFYLLEPLLYQWLTDTNKLHLLDTIETYRFDKRWFSYSIMEESPKIEPWILHFPFDESDIKYIKGIIYFFETFQRYHDFPFVKRVEVCVRHKRYPIPNDILKRLVKFLAENFKHERVRMIMSDYLRDYLQ